MLKVLIADDDEIFINEFLKPNIRTFLKLPLEADLEVTTASNGEDAFEKYKKNEPHVMITDYEMPKMNGKELLSKIYAYKYKPQQSFLLSSHTYIKPETDTKFINKTEVLSMLFNCRG